MNSPGVKPVVELKRLTRSFEQGGERIDVLRGVDLAIRPGEIVALLGPPQSIDSFYTSLGNAASKRRKAVAKVDLRENDGGLSRG